MNSIQNLSFSGKPERVTIGDNTYEFNIMLINGDGQTIGIKYSSLVELSISDTLTNFYADGYVIFNNALDALESVQSISTDVRGRPEQAFSTFTFRGDGRDFLAINIQPSVHADDTDPINHVDNKNQFSLNYMFSILDMQDIITEDKETKLKKLYFCDFVFQILNEKNAYFSTGKLSTDKGKGNTNRSIYTGEAIKQLLASTLSQDTGLVQKFSTMWDRGEEKIFYSSPAGCKAIDDLYYLLDYHVSTKENDYSPALLRKNRQNIWTLSPVTELFKSAYYRGSSSLGDIGGTGLIENFIIGKPTSGDYNPINSIERNPKTSFFANNLPDYSYIENFESANISAPSSTYGVATHAVHSYNVSEKTFSIDLAENSINSAFKKYKKHFVQTQKGLIGSSPSANLSLNKTKTDNKNVHHVFNPNPAQTIRLNSGSNKILLNSIFNNTTIGFKTRGSIFREAGKFFTVDRRDFANSSAFDNKMLGTYLITKVDHVFKNGQYLNYLVGVKTYAVEKTKNSNEII
jgi:hypothetical protein